MILLVPLSPEVPPHHTPRLLYGLAVALLLSVVFLETKEILEKDTQYLESVLAITLDEDLSTRESYLAKRPLLTIAPSKGDWSIKRVMFANLIHGSVPHLVLNLVGLIAGITICVSFVPIAVVLSLFFVGGSLGLLGSILFTPDPSHYIPHVGASAGIFSLMGAYYVYNFRFRTRYFFWFPSQHGRISLPTHWFFFLDVILLELVLSCAQFFPTRIDSVDHVAHVIGFCSGVGLVLMLRFFQQWPAFLQTRAEYLYWNRFHSETDKRNPSERLQLYLTLLRINPYNDLLKHKLLYLLLQHDNQISETEFHQSFAHINPTFVRLHTERVAHFIREMLSRNRTFPKAWLLTLPYDSVIKISQGLAKTTLDPKVIFEFVNRYRSAQQSKGLADPKLELLLKKLDPTTGPSTAGETLQTEGAAGNPPPIRAHLPK